MSPAKKIGPRHWLQHYCPFIDGQFLFLDPISWNTHLLTAGAATVLSEAADAIEERRFAVFVREVDEAGGWPQGLEFLARSLTLLREDDPAIAESE